MEKPYYYENDLRDFKMPYQLYGKIDYEVMKDKYLSLTNHPNRATSKRFIIPSKW
jgi:hypothetical protein